MIKKLSLLLVAVVSLFIFWDSTTFAAAKLNQFKEKKVTLLTVERFKNDIVENSSYEIKTFLEERVYPYGYKTKKEIIEIEDEFVKIQFNFIKIWIEMFLENKTDRTMKLHWDEVMYIDEMGFSQKVTYIQDDYSSKNESRPPAIIAKNSKIYDRMIPVNNVRYERFLFSGEWVYDNLGYGDVSLIIPIEINGIINEYTFNFSLSPKIK